MSRRLSTTEKRAGDCAFITLFRECVQRSAKSNTFVIVKFDDDRDAELITPTALSKQVEKGSAKIIEGVEEGAPLYKMGILGIGMPVKAKWHCSKAVFHDATIDSIWSDERAAKQSFIDLLRTINPDRAKKIEVARDVSESDQ